MLSKRQIAVACLLISAAWYWQGYIAKGPVYQDYKDLTGKTVLITGGNDGIGKVTAIEFAKMGARVAIASRNVEKSEKAKAEISEQTSNSNIAIYHLDLEDFDSIRSFVRKFKENEENLDILINNAGVSALRGKTPSGYNRVFAINHFGPFLLTNLLLDKMKAQSKQRPVRIVNLASFAYTYVRSLDFSKFREEAVSGIDDLLFYGRTKLANILFTSELHRRLRDYDITTYAVHPGLIDTEISGGLSSTTFGRIIIWLSNKFSRPVFYGAQTVLYCALDDEATKYSGSYFSDCVKRWLLYPANDETLAKELWKESMRITNC